MSWRGTCWAGALFLTLLGCSPALDWREVRPDGAGVIAMFPCRPQHHRRSVRLEEVTVPVHLLVCSSAGQTFGIAYLDVAEPEEVAPALLALSAAAARNLSAVDARATPLKIAGMTPNANAALVSFRGLAPNGMTVHSQVGLFARGLRVYQATLFGSDIGPEASDTFFSGMKLH